jgi:phosphopantothenoylcysteine decarboxylase/phosphopantothenate--cysteine ligase
MNVLENKNILLCITGSIAAYKSCEIIRALRKNNAQVQVAISKAAQEFIGVSTLAALSNNKVITNLFPDKPKGGLEHIDLAFDIDLIVIAPATANILCKVGNGIADDLISTTLSVCEQKQIFAPAMNYRMWQNQATIDAVKKLKKRNKIVLNPEEGKLASLHTGEGRLPSIQNIMNEIRKAFDTKLYLENKNVLVTAGPTREAIDPVRFISNRSSGKMGYAIAKSAKDFGANVDLVSGPVNLGDLSEINIIKVETADEMDSAIQSRLKKINYDYIFMTAAVSDYKVETIKINKIKSDNASLKLQLSKSTDILKKIAASQNSAKIIGFALETNNGEDEALKKLKNKKLDYIVLNYANEEGAGFETNTNHVFLYSKSGHKTEFKLDRKDRIAKNIIKQVL